MSSNRRFTEFALLNTPKDSHYTFYVNGPKYKEMQRIVFLKTCNWALDAAYYSKLPLDSEVRHSRNANMKD